MAQRLTVTGEQGRGPRQVWHAMGAGVSPSTYAIHNFIKTTSSNGQNQSNRRICDVRVINDATQSIFFTKVLDQHAIFFKIIRIVLKSNEYPKKRVLISPDPKNNAFH